LRAGRLAASFARPAGGDGVISGLFELLFIVIRFYIWIVIAAAAYSMLAAFGVIDTRNRVVWTIGDFLYRATDPALRPIRRFLPNLGSVDISPIILILLLQFILVPFVHGVHAAVMTGSLQPLLF
jgi:YggT family protein